MRSDFESYVAKLPELDRLFQAGRVQVTALNRDQLREAIEGPAATVNLKFERGLVNALIDDTVGELQAGAALAIHAAQALGEALEQAQQGDASGVPRSRGSVARRVGHSADELYERGLLEESDRGIARRILLRLVRPGDGLEVTSSRVPVDQLTHPVQDAAKIKEVLEKLWHHRLVRITPPGPPESWSADTQAEIATRRWSGTGNDCSIGSTMCACRS